MPSSNKSEVRWIAIGAPGAEPAIERIRQGAQLMQVQGSQNWGLQAAGPAVLAQRALVAQCAKKDCYLCNEAWRESMAFHPLPGPRFNKTVALVRQSTMHASGHDCGFRYNERYIVGAAMKDTVDDPILYDEMKEDIAGYPFAQAPRLVDGDINIVQSNAILRHIARKYNMYGSTEADQCRVDEVLDGIQALRGKYVDLVYGKSLEDSAKAEHWETHGSPETLSGRNSGAHWGYLAAMLTASGTGFVTGSTITVADCALFDLADNYMRTFADSMHSQYPGIVEHFELMKAQPGVKAHLENGNLHEHYNNNQLG